MLLNTHPIHFENLVGYVQAQPQGYVLVCYHAGPRQGTDLMVLLTQAGALLQAKGWHCILSDQRLMAPYSPVEEEWVHAFWASQQAGCSSKLYLAVVASPAPP